MLRKHQLLCPMWIFCFKTTWHKTDLYSSFCRHTTPFNRNGWTNDVVVCIFREITSQSCHDDYNAAMTSWEKHLLIKFENITLKYFWNTKIITSLIYHWKPVVWWTFVWKCQYSHAKAIMFSQGNIFSKAVSWQSKTQHLILKRPPILPSTAQKMSRGIEKTAEHSSWKKFPHFETDFFQEASPEPSKLRMLDFMQIKTEISLRCFLRRNLIFSRLTGARLNKGLHRALAVLYGGIYDITTHIW